MGTGTSLHRLTLLLASLVLFPVQRSSADVLVDNSPDNSGAAVISRVFSQRFPGQYLGDRFTLPAASIIEGGSIFGRGGAVGDPVRFVILPDVAGVPDSVPILDVLTTTDMVDSTLTTKQTSLIRRHASIPPQLLPAGTYWFWLADTASTTRTQATGIYDDNAFFIGHDDEPDLDGGPFPDFGDTFFTIDGVPYVDSDGDGVLDHEDFCGDTAIPEGVPTRQLNPNHWALVNDDIDFDTVLKGKDRPPNRSYMIDDTAGCSCEQIIAMQGLGNGHTKHGCSISAMDDWVELVNQ